MPKVATATKQSEVTFVTRIINYRLTQIPEDWEELSGGRRRRILGHAAVFDEVTGTYTTSDPEEIEWLRNHDEFGSKFVEAGSDEPKPTVAEQVTAVASAVDIDQLEEIDTLERETHNRQIVLDAVHAAAERMAPEAGADEETSSTSPPADPS
jgi:hypothetical protein